ncbi:hypothetical protein D3C86_1276180 [compost metagenome]
MKSVSLRMMAENSSASPTTLFQRPQLVRACKRRAKSISTALSDSMVFSMPGRSSLTITCWSSPFSLRILAL